MHVPAKTGRAAFEELDRVAWGALAHAYGRGVVKEGRGSDAMHFDVARSMRELEHEDEETREDARNTLFAMVCHQGTIYEASPHVVPFLAAYAAGDDVEIEHAKFAVYLAAHIGASSTFVAPTLSHAGAASADVAKETREAFVASRAHLGALVLHMPEAAKLVSALLTLRDGPDEWARIDALANEAVA